MHVFIWYILFVSIFCGLFFGRGATLSTTGLLDSSCTGAFAGFDARIISNNPSSVRKAVLYKDMKLEVLEYNKERNQQQITCMGLRLQTLAL